MWINDKVIYTPEIVTVEKGEPVVAIIESVSVGGLTMRVKLPNGEKIEVAAAQCELATV